MAGFVTHDVKVMLKLEYVAWQMGMTLEEVLELYKKRGGYYDEQEKEAKKAEETGL